MEILSGIQGPCNNMHTGATLPGFDATNGGISVAHSPDPNTPRQPLSRSTPRRICRAGWM